MSDPLHTIFEDVGYRIEYSCLYFPQAQVLCGYEVQLNMYFFILNKSPPFKIIAYKAMLLAYYTHIGN